MGSRFYASIRGQARTDATRQGSPKSAITGHVRGWNVGVLVHGFVNTEGNDCFHVYATGGSNGYRQDMVFCEVYETNDGKRSVKFNLELLKRAVENDGKIEV